LYAKWSVYDLFHTKIESIKRKVSRDIPTYTATSASHDEVKNLQNKLHEQYVADKTLDENVINELKEKSFSRWNQMVSNQYLANLTEEQLAAKLRIKRLDETLGSIHEKSQEILKAGNKVILHRLENDRDILMKAGDMKRDIFMPQPRTWKAYLVDNYDQITALYSHSKRAIINEQKKMKSSDQASAVTASTVTDTTGGTATDNSATHKSESNDKLNETNMEALLTESLAQLSGLSENASGQTNDSPLDTDTHLEDFVPQASQE